MSRFGTGHLVLPALLAALLQSNLAAADADRPAIEPTIHPELFAHTDRFHKKIYKIGSNVYSAVGWGLANTVMIEGSDGIVIVDVGEDIDSAREVHKELRKISGKPVRAIVYTHFHPDHINGVKAFTSVDDVASGAVKIIAHESLLDNVINQGAIVGPILGMRTGYTAGVFLEDEDNAGMNFGIGPMPNVGNATFIAPTHTYEAGETLSVAGITLELRHVPSEAPDETAVYLPQERILLSGETTQGPTLPNIHTLRGTRYRDPVRWYKSIDVLRSYRAEHLVPSHGTPVSGQENVEQVLTMTRDGIQYIHDQTVRHMNKGLTPDELVEVVKLPPRLANYEPYLREYYGTVKHSVRQIYHGYLGWFNGDPVDLDPVAPLERSRRYVELMGGREAVLATTNEVYGHGDYQWAAELATHLIRADTADMEARQLKADSFRHLGYAQINPNWRNWYLTSARELDGSLDVVAAQRRLMLAIASPDLISALPPARLLESLSVRLKAEDTHELQLTVAFHIDDTDEKYALELRNGIVQFHRMNLPAGDATLILQSSDIFRLLSGQVTVAGALESGTMQALGDDKVISQFLGYFDSLAQINLTVR